MLYFGPKDSFFHGKAELSLKYYSQSTEDYSFIQKIDITDLALGLVLSHVLGTQLPVITSSWPLRGLSMVVGYGHKTSQLQKGIFRLKQRWQARSLGVPGEMGFLGQPRHLKMVGF